MPIVTYPETVDLARVLATPRWRHPTAPASRNELRQFQHDIHQHLGIEYHPETAFTTPSSAGSASATDSQANPAFAGLPHDQ